MTRHDPRAELQRLIPEIRDDLAYSNKLTLGRLRNEYGAGRLLNEIERNRGGRPSKNGRGRDRSLADLGVTKSESYRWRLLAAIPEAVFDAELQRLEDGAERHVRSGHEVTRESLLRLGREYAAQRRRADTAMSHAGGIRFHVADICDGLPFMPDASIDAILCDPPYRRDALPLYGALATVAQRVLRSGGLCAVMIGQTWLPEIIDEMSAHLDYRWLIAYETRGGTNRVWNRRNHADLSIRSHWKPVVVFANGASPAWRTLRSDIVTSPARDKTHHQHGQNADGIRGLVELLTEPGQRVLDPFLGGASTAVACVQTGRQFVGADIDPDCIAAARRRLGRDERCS